VSPRNKVTDARTPDTRCSRCRDREQGDELTRAHKLLSSTVCSADLRSVFETRCEAPPGAVRCVARELCRRLTPPSQKTSGHSASGNGRGQKEPRKFSGRGRRRGGRSSQQARTDGAPQRQGKHRPACQKAWQKTRQCSHPRVHEVRAVAFGFPGRARSVLLSARGGPRPEQRRPTCCCKA